MKKWTLIILDALFIVAATTSANAQQVAYLSAGSVGVNTSWTQILGGSITLTRTGAISIVSQASFYGGNSVGTQIYVDGTAYGTETDASANTYGGGGQLQLNTSNTTRVTGLSSGSHTIAIYAYYYNTSSSGMTCTGSSALVTLENEDSAALSTEVANIIAAYQLADSQLQALIDALTTRVTTLESSMSTAQGDISTLQGQVSTLQTQMTTANAGIASNTSDIADLKSQIGSLQSKLDSMKQNDDLAQSGVGLGAAGLGSLLGYGIMDSTSSSSTSHIRQVLSK